MTFLLCTIQTVICLVGSPECCKSHLHGQLRGEILSLSRAGIYLADFSKAAKHLNLQGDFSDVAIDKRDCVKVTQ